MSLHMTQKKLEILAQEFQKIKHKGNKNLTLQPHLASQLVTS